jgi:hypothetical protein
MAVSCKTTNKTVCKSPHAWEPEDCPQAFESDYSEQLVTDSNRQHNGLALGNTALGWTHETCDGNIGMLTESVEKYRYTNNIPTHKINLN